MSKSPSHNISTLRSLRTLRGLPSQQKLRNSSATNSSTTSGMNNHKTGPESYPTYTCVTLNHIMGNLKLTPEKLLFKPVDRKDKEHVFAWPWESLQKHQISAPPTTTSDATSETADSREGDDCDQQQQQQQQQQQPPQQQPCLLKLISQQHPNKTVIMTFSSRASLERIHVDLTNRLQPLRKYRKVKETLLMTQRKLKEANNTIDELQETHQKLLNVCDGLAKKVKTLSTELQKQQQEQIRQTVSNAKVRTLEQQLINLQLELETIQHEKTARAIEHEMDVQDYSHRLQTVQDELAEERATTERLLDDRMNQDALQMEVHVMARELKASKEKSKYLQQQLEQQQVESETLIWQVRQGRDNAFLELALIQKERDDLQKQVLQLQQYQQHQQPQEQGESRDDTDRIDDEEKTDESHAFAIVPWKRPEKADVDDRLMMMMQPSHYNHSIPFMSPQLLHLVYQSLMHYMFQPIIKDRNSGIGQQIASDWEEQNDRRIRSLSQSSSSSRDGHWERESCYSGEVIRSYYYTATEGGRSQLPFGWKDAVVGNSVISDHSNPLHQLPLRVDEKISSEATFQNRPVVLEWRSHPSIPTACANMMPFQSVSDVLTELQMDSPPLKNRVVHDSSKTDDSEDFIVLTDPHPHLASPEIHLPGNKTKVKSTPVQQLPNHLDFCEDKVENALDFDITAPFQRGMFERKIQDIQEFPSGSFGEGDAADDIWIALLSSSPSIEHKDGVAREARPCDGYDPYIPYEELTISLDGIDQVD